MITLKLTDTIDVIQGNVNTALSSLLNKYIKHNLSKVLLDCKNLVAPWITNQPEIQSLISSNIDSLAGQFGIRPGSKTDIVNAIIQSVENSIIIKFIPFSPSFKGGIEVSFQPSNFVNLLNLSQGHVIYKGGDLHWMDWLLMRGDGIIVVNYEYNAQSGLGRSRLGNMREGGSFRVPPQYSGTDSDNFITRALIGKTQEQEITQIFKLLLGK